MSPDEMREHAEQLILDHARDIEFLSIGESLEGVLGDADSDEYGRVAREIDRLIRHTAEITITWPTGGGSDA